MDEVDFFENCIKNKQFPRNDAKKQIVLKQIMKKEFEIGKVYDDPDVNEKLKKYYPDEYPTIRRELVNYGYFQVDSHKGEYKAIKLELSKEDYENNKKLLEHAKDAGLF